MTQSEYLTRNAARIDFSKNLETEDPEKKNGEEATAPATSSIAPFENILMKLREAYTEVSVLHDVLAVAKEKHYMVLDPVPTEMTETKQMALIYARKFLDLSVNN